ncbi:hypothetical protein [Prevotella intermedia]|jgi:hypothetical protein|uniref:hypothetical protein n=1 Tax=Prevotella intermedia TaxID=28131 RepID=UPI00077DFF82|nr:hypothetical protein [Prevotella intermedia]ATV28713.1 hypothetical protein CTM63_05960 [Prevotella intermedia]
MRINEIVAPKDKLDESLEMIKGGTSSELRLCIKGCHTGELKPKPNTSATSTETTSKDETANTSVSDSNLQ